VKIEIHNQHSKEDFINQILYKYKVFLARDGAFVIYNDRKFNRHYFLLRIYLMTVIV